ncbi:hypothetical protein GCM10010124_07200 [Pilimelia terevasa]|uniref:Secreted protein n=1 Tax=Pilimelia terevasa TaxID=53372 RepID=A0A8J3FF95_9ACTN|nr:hypothetical protein [Pilimelia terevasa]GGK17217.1 hypothetical protein GCM10010124_07200 [Pilimelia terevasa]
MTDTVAAALARVRGPAAPVRHNARTIAALTGNPDCRRRAVLDAAGVDKTALAQYVGHPARYGQSPFAIIRGHAFEARVKADGYAALRALVAAKLPGADVAGPAVDLGDGGADNAARYARTRAVLGGDEVALADHPLLRLSVAGQHVYLEPDLVACRVAGRLHVVEVKSFPVLDGRADPAKVAAAAVQAAVYVLGLRELRAAGGADPDAVATDALLVCPRDFGHEPTVAVLDLRRQVAVLRRQLRRLARVADLLADLPADFTVDLGGEGGAPARPPGAVAAALARLAARYTPDCLAACELAYHCRAEAAGSTAALGPAVREELGGVPDVAAVLAYADGAPPADPTQAEAAAVLRRAARLRAEALAGAAVWEC